MKYAVAVACVFAAYFFMQALNWPAHDADIAWQQWLGNHILHDHRLPERLGSETFTAAGVAWVPQEWAFSLVVAAAIKAHAFGFVAFGVTLAALSALLLTAWRSQRRGASAAAIAITTILTGVSMLQSFGARDQILAWPLLALLALLLDSEGDRVFWALPLVALWANLHASALLAPAFVGAWSTGTLVEDRGWTLRVERNAVLTAGTLVAVCATPLLWHLPLYAWHIQTSVIRNTIVEWQPSDVRFISFGLGLLPLVAICAYFGIAAPRERWRDGFLFACATALAFSAVRHIPLCALVIAPMAAQRLSSILNESVRMNLLLRERLVGTFALTACAVASAGLVVYQAQLPALAEVTLPVNAVNRLADFPGRHRLFCEDFAWCSLALGKRNVRTFLDGRCDPFPASTWNAYLAIARVKPRWRSALTQSKTDAVLATADRPLARALRSSSEWVLLYTDTRYTLFVRKAKSGQSKAD